MSAIEGDGQFVDRAIGGGGLVIFVGSEPLVEAKLSSDGHRYMVLHARPRTSYQIERATGFGFPFTWTIESSVTQTNLVQPVELMATTNSVVFYRANAF